MQLTHLPLTNQSKQKVVSFSYRYLRAVKNGKDFQIETIQDNFYPFLKDLHLL